MKQRARKEGVYVDGLVRSIGIPWDRVVGSWANGTATEDSLRTAKIEPELNVYGSPKRKVRSRSKTVVTGAFASQKMSRQIETEGILETFFVPFLEIDTSIKAYLEQPAQMKFVFKGEEVIYTPDFFVVYRDGRQEIIEVKPSAKLKDELIVFLSAIGQMLSLHDISFRIVDGKDIKDKTLFSNVSLLDYARRAPLSAQAWQAYTSSRDAGAQESLHTLGHKEWLALVAHGLVRTRIDIPLRRECH